MVEEDQIVSISQLNNQHKGIQGKISQQSYRESLLNLNKIDSEGQFVIIPKKPLH